MNGKLAKRREAWQHAEACAAEHGFGQRLAGVIVGKVADHLPVHRQAKIFRRFGIELADQTLCGWLRQSAELLGRYMSG